MRTITLLFFVNLFTCTHLAAQTYSDFFGNGHDVGVTISTSSAQGSNQATNTLNGTGYLPDTKGASRFLAQSTFGADYELINQLTQISIDDWIEQQSNIAGSSYTNLVTDIQATSVSEFEAVFGSTDGFFRAGLLINKAFWQKLVTEDDLLRQRIAFALSQILVVSQLQIDDCFALASYYDILFNNAFGNYRDILYQISIHPAMGIYLSHLNNPKSDPTNNIRPDENFAREIMQLFSIGLYELNNDGSQKLDNNGNPIPTYDNNDIKEFAKIFTGLSGSGWNLDVFPELANEPIAFGWYPDLYDFTQPMMMFEDYHEQGAKYLLNAQVVPAGQTGMQDVNQAIDNLFNHPNLPPFLATRLIQFFVKSNPTPAYINRVALAFINNGQGERGDMKAVVRAVLTDPEARDCEWIDDVAGGKLREPMLRYSQLIRAFNIENESNRYWYVDNWDYDNTKQAFLASPSVFNFFAPSYTPSGAVAENNLVAPEFQILNATTGINYINSTWGRVFWQPMWVTASVNPAEPSIYAFYPDVDDETSLDLTDELNAYTWGGVTGLINRLDILLSHGQLSTQARTTLQNALQQYEDLGWVSDEDIVKMGIFFILVSPDYSILK